MNEATFIANFVTTFLATWVATNYDDACMRDQHERLEKPPVEDAVFLAHKAWKELKEHNPVYKDGSVYFEKKDWWDD